MYSLTTHSSRETYMQLEANGSSNLNLSSVVIYYSLLTLSHKIAWNTFPNNNILCNTSPLPTVRSNIKPEGVGPQGRGFGVSLANSTFLLFFKSCSDRGEEKTFFFLSFPLFISFKKKKKKAKSNNNFQINPFLFPY